MARKTIPHEKPLPKGLKLTCPGRHAVGDLQEILLQSLRELESRNIRFVSGLNIYLTAVDEHGRPLLHYPDGRNIPGDIIAIDRPYRSAADEHGL
jgi:hypothetical protein